MPSRLPAEVRQRLKGIRLVVLDADGVLTDGRLMYGATGEAFKEFNVRDGLGIRLLLAADLQVAVLSGRRSDALAVRCRELGLREDLVIQGAGDKAGHLDELERILGLDDEQVAAMGDDLPDLPVLSRVACAACPADAAPEVAAICHIVCGAPGGRGVVREFAELVLKSQGSWQRQVGRWTAPKVAEGGPPEA